MHKAVCSRENLHKCAKVHNLSYLAEIYLSNLSLLGKFLDHSNGLLRSLIVRGGNIYLSGIIYIHFYAGFFYNAFNVLSARPYNIPYLILFNINGDYPWR